MKRFTSILKPALLCFVILMLLCGVMYTGAVTGVAQLMFPNEANGSVIAVTLKDGSKKEYGSRLIAQEFTKPEYLIGRPLGTTNLSPTSAEQKALVQERIDWWHAFDPSNAAEIPLDLVTASGSGVDPHITPEAAEYQVKRIAAARGIEEEAVRGIIREYTKGRFLGLFGERAVNVLQVNLALDGLL